MTFFRRLICMASTAAVAASTVGCVQTGDVRYFGEKDETNYYLDRATRVDYAAIDEEPATDVASLQSPRTVSLDRKDDVWDLPLDECVMMGLQNNRIIRSRAGFLSGANPILNNADRATSIYDPAIQESGVLFGGRGVESALAAFDANFSTRMTWRRNETISNVLIPGVPPDATLNADESADFDARLSKNLAYGANLSLSHGVNYFGSPAGTMFDSTYGGLISAQYRHPLLAGSGTEFTRIAGPIADSFGGLTGVSQGVVIARINNDITIADLEASLTNFVKDVQDAYWDLYLRYRLYDTVVQARNSALRTWRDAKLKRDVGGAPGFTLEDEAQARDRYFETQAQAKQSLSDIYQAEVELRRLIGLGVNDGRIIRPADEPLTARYEPDWSVSIADGLTRRVELRKQKWQLKSLELQLLAAENLVRPRLDLVAGYQVNGFGDRLLNYDSPDRAGTRQQLNSFYSNITQGNQTGWNMGLVFELPIGLRAARAQVQNIELRLAKSREALSSSEMEISHEIANAFQNLTESYAVTSAYINRRNAALERVRLTEANEKVGKQTIDMVLRAQSSLSDAEVAYYRALVGYTQAVTNLHFRTGTLLAQNAIYLSESEWTPEAYEQALRKARERSASKDASGVKSTEPAEFAMPAEWMTTSLALPNESAVLAVPAPEAPPVEPVEKLPAPAPEAPSTLPSPAPTSPADSKPTLPDQPEPKLLPKAPPAKALPLPSDAAPKSAINQPGSLSPSSGQSRWRATNKTDARAAR